MMLSCRVQCIDQVIISRPIPPHNSSLIHEGHLSVAGITMCTKFWSSLRRTPLAQGQCDVG